MPRKLRPRTKRVPAASDRQKSDDALRECEARFSVFMEHMPAAAFLKDLEGRYVYINPNFVGLTGRAPGLCSGSSDEEYWPDSAEKQRVEDRRVIRTGQTLTSEEPVPPEARPATTKPSSSRFQAKMGSQPS